MSKKPFFFNFLERLNYKKILVNNTNPLELLDRLSISKKRNTKHNPKILILTKKMDIESDLLGIQLLKNGIDYAKITEEDIPLNFSYEFLIGEKNKFLVKIDNKKIDLKDIKIVLFRYFDLKFLNYYSGLLQTYFVQQWYQTFISLQKLLNCLWINDPQNTFNAENRLNQLIVAQRIGFNIPETSITNAPVAGKSFFNRYRNSTIIKVLHHHEINLGHLSYRFLTNKIERSHLSKLDELVYAPVIFQKKVEINSEIRVTLIDNKTFSCLISSNMNKDKKYSDIHKIKEKQLKFTEINLEKRIEKLCLKLNKELGLLVSSIDFILDKKGEIYFLEVNPIGDWNWLEKHTELPITKSIFNLLHSHLDKTDLK